MNILGCINKTSVRVSSLVYRLCCISEKSDRIHYKIIMKVIDSNIDKQNELYRMFRYIHHNIYIPGHVWGLLHLHILYNINNTELAQSIFRYFHYKDYITSEYSTDYCENTNSLKVPGTTIYIRNNDMFDTYCIYDALMYINKYNTKCCNYILDKIHLTRYHDYDWYKDHPAIISCVYQHKIWLLHGLVILADSVFIENDKVNYKTLVYNPYVDIDTLNDIIAKKHISMN